jgi:hypothetical protein
MSGEHRKERKIFESSLAPYVYTVQKHIIHYSVLDSVLQHHHIHITLLFYQEKKQRICPSSQFIDKFIVSPLFLTFISNIW